MKEVYIIDALRTPIGSFLGELSKVDAPKLGASCIKSLLERNNVKPEIIDEVILGNVVSAGIGQAPARMAAMYAGLKPSANCMTINKVCGSGMKSVMLAAQSIMLGDTEVAMAGGMENMSKIPHYLLNSRLGYKMGDQKIVDGMTHDGLMDPYDNIHMGCLAELCAKEYSFSREEQDEFAEQSYKRAIKATEDGKFKDEIVPIEIPQRKGDPKIVDRDEEPFKVNFEKMKKLKPVFEKDGSVTAANASSINDGASVLLLMSKEKAEELDLKPMAKLVSYSTASKDPKWFTTAPIDSINNVLEKTSKKVDDIDLFEINEAFSVVSLVANKELNIPIDKVNINGGAVALGHPIGASGARIITTLLHALKENNLKRGVASLCIGGGEATSVMVETL